MEVPIDSYEKLYWTDDPEPRNPEAIWYVKSWEKSGLTKITIDDETELSTTGASSKYWYPSNVKFIMATEGAIASPGQISWVIVKIYAYDTGFNGAPAASWSPGTGTYYDKISRPYTGSKTFPIAVVHISQPFSESYNYTSVVGYRTATVDYKGIFTFTYKASYYTIKVGVHDWSKAPSNAQELAIYILRNDASQVKAAYKP